MGYVVDVQAALLYELATRTVVPLLPSADAPQPIRELNPLFDIAGVSHVMLTQAIATLPAKLLKGPITSLDSRHSEITRALDILLVGY